jgi:hypothetical protein
MNTNKFGFQFSSRFLKNKKKVMFVGFGTYAVLIALTLFSGTSRAQSVTTEAPSSKKTITNAKGEKVTVIDFDDANIDGKALAPDGFVVQSRQSGKFKGMIELRRDFRPQMEQATHDALASMAQN